jgi:hypothetical protein
VARRLGRRLALGFRRGQLGADRPDQPLVLGQSKEVIDPMSFAPRHQSLARKAAVGT